MKDQRVIVPLQKFLDSGYVIEMLEEKWLAELKAHFWKSILFLGYYMNAFTVNIECMGDELCPVSEVP